MEQLNESITVLRDMRERLSAMLVRVKGSPDLRDGGELFHVTGELIKSLEREIQVLEKVIAGKERRNVA